MSEIILQYFNAAPIIPIKAESYHITLNNRKLIRVTNSGEEQVKYYSFKDSSGRFTLKIRK